MATRQLKICARDMSNRVSQDKALQFRISPYRLNYVDDCVVISKDIIDTTSLDTGEKTVNLLPNSPNSSYLLSFPEFKNIPTIRFNMPCLLYTSPSPRD